MIGGSPSDYDYQAVCTDRSALHLRRAPRLPARSREHNFPSIRAALLSMLRAWGSPFT